MQILSIKSRPVEGGNNFPTGLRKFLLRFGRNRDGVAAVEFALVLPVMLMLVLGSLEAGRMFQLKNSMTFHTRTITREIALGQLSGNEAVSELTERLNSYADLTYIVNIHEPSSGNSFDKDVVVSVKVSQSDAKAYAVTGWLVKSDLTAVATMRKAGNL